jgi:fructose-bisphosphate aldolase class I
MNNIEQRAKILSADGFIAALDQSGGSTPKALKLYGIDPTGYNEDTEMFDLVHAMRARIVQSKAFSTDHIVGAILFEQTMDRLIGGLPAADYLWKTRAVVPFLKVDKGLAASTDGVSLMKPIDGLDALLQRGVEANIFGTKMRSLIESASESGIEAVVAQQFEIAKKILGHGLVPIIEPEISITATDKAAAEGLLLQTISRHLDKMAPDQEIMLKLTLPETANHYAPLVADDRVLRVVALSGGYDRKTATDMLAKNAGVIASFSRAPTEGLSIQQNDAAFDTTLGQAVAEIYDASVSG